MDRKFKTTFFEDFTIADKFGRDGIIDTYMRVFRSWYNNYKYLTELVIALNWKIWEHYDKGDRDIAQLYQELREKCDGYAMDNLKGEQLTYYIRQTD